MRDLVKCLYGIFGENLCMRDSMRLIEGMRVDIANEYLFLAEGLLAINPFHLHI